ncbi:hypothetical protein BJ912DRAFT_955598 [Pholiota molesta]|nr:hypothetical protein BJ912DRAFT_955598 [Pholiota molesta]
MNLRMRLQSFVQQPLSIPARYDQASAAAQMQGSPPQGPADDVQLPSFASLLASVAHNSETGHAGRRTPLPTSLLMDQTPITPTGLCVTYTPHSTPQRASRSARSDNTSDHTLKAASDGTPHLRKYRSIASGSQKQPSTRRPINWARAKPGQRVKLLDVDIFNPIVCPRAAEYCTDAEYVIEFAVRDMPGPSIRTLMTGGCHLDEESEEVFKRYGLKTANLRFEWPGLVRRNVRIYEASTLTRAQLAAILAFSIGTKAVTDIMNDKNVQVLDETSRRWDLRQIDMKKLRLFSLNYYKHTNTWVPILGYEIVITHDR